MNMNWNEYRKNLLKNVGSLGAEIPETLKGYQTIAESVNHQGVLDQKTQELISVKLCSFLVYGVSGRVAYPAD